MTAPRIVADLNELLALAQKAADHEATGGPSWIFQLSLSAIDLLQEMLKAAHNGTLQIGPGFSFRERLGATWVDLHGDIYALCERLDSRDV